MFNFNFIKYNVVCVLCSLFIGWTAAQKTSSTWPSPTNGGYTCEICGATYRHPQSWYSHKQTHRGRTNCKICGKTFSRIALLNNHLIQIHHFQATKSRGLRHDKGQEQN